jgi:hypothetical protein
MRAISAVAGLLALTAGCATVHKPASGDSASMSLEGRPGPVTRFTGRFTPVANITSGEAVSGSQRFSGTVTVTSAPGSDDEFTVDIRFTSERGAEELHWSIVEGSCGAGGLPLVPPRQLRSIEVSGTDLGQLTTDFHATLTTGINYHLNLYANGGSELSSVVGCANLKS